MRQVFLDTETTGLSPEAGDRIVEIGCIEMLNRRLTGRTLHQYLNPQRASHPDALKVHGLSEERLAGEPLFADVAAAIIEFVRGADVVIHNAAFDTGFLDAELARCGLPPLRQHAQRITDSLQLARELYPGKHNSLDALCRRLEVDNSSRTLHGALLDARLLAEVYLNMTRGQGALVIDSAAGGNGASGAGSVANAVPRVDLAAFTLPLLATPTQDLARHEAVLAGIDNESKGRAVWKPAQAAMA